MAPPPPAPRPRRPSRAPPRAGRRLRGRRAAGIGGGPPPSRPLPASRPPPRTRTGRARAWRGEGGCCCGGLRAPGLVAPVPESRPCGSWLLRRPPRPGVGDLPAGGGGKGARCRPSGVCPLAGHEAGAAYDDIRRPVRPDGPRVGLAGQGGISGGGPPRPGAGPAGGRGRGGGRGRTGWLAPSAAGGRAASAGGAAGAPLRAAL